MTSNTTPRARLGPSHLTMPFTLHRLSNGMAVVLHEDHTCPIVGVNLWYHVGSKNDSPSRTGFAHLVEHLMFEGSAHHDSGYFAPLLAAGAALNASTSPDRTNFWEVVPAPALELALWMESDRMGFLLPALTEARFATQREVVLNERRQNYENRPYGVAPMALRATLFGSDHPYSWTPIGAADHLRAAVLEEVHEFVRRYYHPANASLAIAGDIDPERALDLARACFDDIPPGPPVGPVQADVVPPPVRRLSLEDRVRLPRLYSVWLTPGLFAAADAEIDLAVHLLANGPTSRLYRRLVFEEQLATDVSGGQNSREMAGFAEITVTALPERGLADVERVVLEEIARLASDGPSEDELERSRVQVETQFTVLLQNVGGFGGRSDQLNAYYTFAGDAGFLSRDLARYASVTRDSLRDAVGAYLMPEARVALSVVPHGRLDLVAEGATPTEVS